MNQRIKLIVPLTNGQAEVDANLLMDLTKIADKYGLGYSVHYIGGGGSDEEPIISHGGGSPCHYPTCNCSARCLNYGKN